MALACNEASDADDGLRVAVRSLARALGARLGEVARARRRLGGGPAGAPGGRHRSPRGSTAARAASSRCRCRARRRARRGHAARRGRRLHGQRRAPRPGASQRQLGALLARDGARRDARALASALLEAEDGVKTRVADVLHDELCQA
ncbi:MAG: hypothetical protein U1F43_13370 [Myxococcota bacterium]